MLVASGNDLVHRFAHRADPENVAIDLPAAHVWDASTVAALDAIRTKCEARGIAVRVTGMNEGSRVRHDRLAGRLAGAHRPSRSGSLVPMSVRVSSGRRS